MVNISLLSRKFVVVLFMYSASPLIMAQVPTPEQMWEVIQQQQRTIEMLKARLGETEKLALENTEAVEFTANAVDQVSVDMTHRSGALRDTSIGGYGELHYNN
ncbi:MAG: hypothetical protein HKN08_08925, partial [Gammaproteobacteria bacterium]|nr:hypothetical protein [Gammaproteobacteria bacterium]